MGIDRIAVDSAKHPATTVVRGWKGNGSPTTTESHNGSTFTEFTMTTISQGSVSKLILAALAAAPNRTAQGSAVRVAVLAQVGGDPTLTHDINCVGNARHDLMKKGLVGDGSVRGEWVLTDLGLAVHEGAPMPKGPGRSAPKAPKTKADAAPAQDTAGETPDPAPAVETCVAWPLAELARAEDSTVPAVDVTVAVTPDTGTPVAVVETPAPVTQAPKRRLKVADAAPAVVVPEWLNDPEVRGAVIENHDCFGAFAAKSAACGECALAGFCRNAKAAQLDLLARKLTTANPITAPAVAAAVSAATAKLDAAVSAVLDPNAPRVAVNPTGGTIKATYDGACGLTGREIKKGMAVRYVQGKGMVLAD